MSFQKIKRLLLEKAGVNCSGYREQYLKRRFEVRLRATGSNTYGKYVVYLRNNPEEFKNLLNDLAINYTMIYFSKESQQQIHMSFFGALKEGGYLITGKSEILSGEPAAKFLAVDHKVRVYQKPSKSSEPLNFSTVNMLSKPLSV